MPMGEMPGKPKGVVWEPSYCLEDDKTHYCTSLGVLGRVEPRPFRCVLCDGRFSAAEMKTDFGAIHQECPNDEGGLHFLGVCQVCARIPDFAGEDRTAEDARWFKE